MISIEQTRERVLKFSPNQEDELTLLIREIETFAPEIL
jgi:hypothetical protein